MYVYNGEKRYQLLLLFTLPVLPANQWICLLSKIMTYKEVAKSTHDEKKIIIQEFRCDLFCEYKIMKLTLQRII